MFFVFNLIIILLDFVPSDYASFFLWGLIMRGWWLNYRTVWSHENTMNYNPRSPNRCFKFSCKRKQIYGRWQISHAFVTRAQNVPPQVADESFLNCLLCWAGHGVLGYKWILMTYSDNRTWLKGIKRIPTPSSNLEPAMADWKNDTYSFPKQTIFLHFFGVIRC